VAADLARAVNGDASGRGLLRVAEPSLPGTIGHARGSSGPVKRESGAKTEPRIAPTSKYPLPDACRRRRGLDKVSHFLFAKAAPTAVLIAGIATYRNPIWAK
jgi:hypothetical protein